LTWSARSTWARTFGGTSALLKPDNFLSSSRREQIRATLAAAKATGRKAYFEFRNGVHDDVLAFIRRNAERIGVGLRCQSVTAVPTTAARMWTAGTAGI
jgi:hypothetical protein